MYTLGFDFECCSLIVTAVNIHFILVIDECKRDNGNCSHICHDTETSYYCSCKHGYKLLNDSKTCKGIVIILLATTN